MSIILSCLSWVDVAIHVIIVAVVRIIFFYPRKILMIGNLIHITIHKIWILHFESIALFAICKNQTMSIQSFNKKIFFSSFSNEKILCFSSHKLLCVNQIAVFFICWTWNDNIFTHKATFCKQQIFIRITYIALGLLICVDSSRFNSFFNICITKSQGMEKIMEKLIN